MKKTWIALLCILLALSITACGAAPAASSAVEASSAQSAASALPEEPAAEAPAKPEEVSAEEPAEPISYQPLMTEETAALIEQFASAAGAVPSEDVPDEEKTDLWRFVEDPEYQAKLEEFRTDVDAALPSAEPNYDAEGNLLSVKDVPYCYPMEDGHSISVFAPIRGFISNRFESYSDIVAFQIAAAETNIDVDFLTISEDAAETQMSLMFAGGDFTDVVSDFLYSYVGTTVSAYENDLIIPLNDYLEEYSPNYYAWINSRPDFLKAVTEDEGNIFAWYNLMPAVRYEGTSWVRTDLLEQFGMESPVTIDEYEDYFAKCVDAGLTATIYADSTTWSNVATSAFDLPGTSGAEGFGIAAYHKGNTIYSAYQSDALKDYMELMHSWYEKGFFSQDLISLSGAAMDRRAQDDLVINGQVGYMMQGVDRYTNYVESTSIEGWDIEPSRNIVKEDGQITHFAPNDPIAESNGSIVITTACEDIEAACRYVDWFYSDFGINTMNYGPEGVTWNWSADGKDRLFTAALYNDQVYNENAGSAAMIYTGYMAWPSISDPYSGMYYSQTTKGIDAVEMYLKDNDDTYYLNEKLINFTTEETEIINSKLADVSTYIAENLVKFLIGDKSMTEWDAFIADLDQLGLQEIIDTYQTAYDRYLSN